MVETTAHVLTNYEVIQDLCFHDEQPIWDKDSAIFQHWSQIKTGQKSDPITHDESSHPELIEFTQGLLLFTLLIMEGMGFTPIQVKGSRKQKQIALFLADSRQINIIPGTIDDGMDELIKEFNASLDQTQYHLPTQMINAEFLQNINKILFESKNLLTKTKEQLEIIKQNNYKIQENTKLDQLLALIALLPEKSIQGWVKFIKKHLPDQFFKETTEKTNSILPSFEIIHKLLFHFQRKTLIEDYIIEQKTIEYFNNTLSEDAEAKQTLQTNLDNTLHGVFNLKMTMLDGFLKLLNFR